MSDLRSAAEQALEFIKVTNARSEFWLVPGSNLNKTVTALKAALAAPARTLPDEVIADLWHQNGGFHHHFARAVERYLKGEK